MLNRSKMTAIIQHPLKNYALLTDVPTATIFKGIFPFWVADIIRMIILVAIPGISLFLPRLLF